MGPEYEASPVFQRSVGIHRMVVCVGWLTPNAHAQTHELRVRPNVVLALILGVHEQDGEERNLLDHDVCTVIVGVLQRLSNRT